MRARVRSESVRRSVCIDMKLTVQTFLTLDGVMQAPGGPEEDPSEAFTHGGWQAPFPDPAVGAFITELTSHASAFLLGRRTFDIFRGYWPDQTDRPPPTHRHGDQLAAQVRRVRFAQRSRCHVARRAPRHRPPGDRRRRRGGAGAEGRTRRRAADLGKQPTAPDAAAARARRPVPPDDVSAGARLRPPPVQRRYPPGNDAPGRPGRDRSRHRHRHLRTSRPGPPRPDVTGRGRPCQAVTPRLAVTAAMTATHTAAQAASAPPTAVPVRWGAGPRAIRQRPHWRTARARFRHPGVMARSPPRESPGVNRVARAS